MDQLFSEGVILAGLGLFAKKVIQRRDDVAVALDFPGIEELHRGDAAVAAAVALGGGFAGDGLDGGDGVLGGDHGDFNPSGQVDATECINRLRLRLDDFEEAVMATELIVGAGRTQCFHGGRQG